MQQKQDIIIQYYREGMSQRQIAQKTGLHRRTVKKYIASYQIARENLLKAEVGDRIKEINLEGTGRDMGTGTTSRYIMPAGSDS